jgi:hypothetical protein
MIRIILGMLIVLGAVGNLDFDADADVLYNSMVAGVGLTLMFFGVRKINESA